MRRRFVAAGLSSLLLMAGSVVASAPALLSAPAASAADICQGNPYGAPCGATVQINESVTPTVISLGLTLDGQDDTVVGVSNSSDQTIPTLELTGVSGLFNFDNDASQGYTWGGVTLTRVDDTSGTVTFAGSGLAPGATASFVLEGAPTSSSTVAPEAPITASGVAPFSVTEGQGLISPLATFSEDAGATLGEFTATINWGDGTTADPAAVSGPVSGVFTVSGSGLHEYANTGVTPVSVTITDSDSGHTGVAATTITASEATITTAAVQNTAVEGVAINNVSVGGFTDLNPLATATDFQATINWGDVATSTTGTVSGPKGGPFTVTGSYDYANASPTGTPYPVTVSVSDVDSATTFAIHSSEAVAELGINVSGVTFSPLQKGAPGFSGTVATITDPNPLAANDYTATTTINWGDGTPTTTGTVTGSTGGPFAVSGAHTWTSAGTYAVTVTVNDPDMAANTGTATSTMTVFDVATPCTGSCSTTDTGTGFASVVNATGTGTVYVGIFGSVTCANDPYHHAPGTTNLTSTPGLTGNITIRLRISPKATKDLDPNHFAICYTQPSHSFVDIHGVTVPAGGTGLLPACGRTPVAPCLQSKFENKVDGVTEIFVIPSGDPGWR